MFPNLVAVGLWLLVIWCMGALITDLFFNPELLNLTQSLIVGVLGLFSCKYWQEEVIAHDERQK